jgi:hypothetical protein
VDSTIAKLDFLTKDSKALHRYSNFDRLDTGHSLRSSRGRPHSQNMISAVFVRVTFGSLSLANC